MNDNPKDLIHQSKEALVAKIKQLEKDKQQLLNVVNYDRGGFYAPSITKLDTGAWAIIRSARKFLGNGKETFIQYYNLADNVWSKVPVAFGSYDEAIDAMSCLMPKWAKPKEISDLEKENKQLAASNQRFINLIEDARLRSSHPDAAKDAQASFETAENLLRLMKNPETVIINDKGEKVTGTAPGTMASYALLQLDGVKDVLMEALMLRTPPELPVFYNQPVITADLLDEDWVREVKKITVAVFKKNLEQGHG